MVFVCARARDRERVSDRYRGRARQRESRRAINSIAERLKLIMLLVFYIQFMFKLACILEVILSLDVKIRISYDSYERNVSVCIMLPFTRAWVTAIRE